MINEYNSHDEAINSICDGFINSVNNTITDKHELLCGQDGYEILTNSFGKTFQKNDIENVSLQQIQLIRDELSDYLERKVNTKEVCYFLNAALNQTFDSFNPIKDY